VRDDEWRRWRFNVLAKQAVKWGFRIFGLWFERVHGFHRIREKPGLIRFQFK